mmetsp:Transcript_3321/g.11126  ORF Transcript_3321/g.11126 Transcript_3321/m.11126 type:complete len:204 (+) Transcript_3321:1519-2130(+)
MSRRSATRARQSSFASTRSSVGRGGHTRRRGGTGGARGPRKESIDRVAIAARTENKYPRSTRRDATSRIVSRRRRAAESAARATRSIRTARRDRERSIARSFFAKTEDAHERSRTPTSRATGERSRAGLRLLGGDGDAGRRSSESRDGDRAARSVAAAIVATFSCSSSASSSIPASSTCSLRSIISSSLMTAVVRARLRRGVQ